MPKCHFCHKNYNPIFDGSIEIEFYEANPGDEDGHGTSFEGFEESCRGCWSLIERLMLAVKGDNEWLRSQIKYDH